MLLLQLGLHLLVLHCQVGVCPLQVLDQGPCAVQILLGVSQLLNVATDISFCLVLLPLQLLLNIVQSDFESSQQIPFLLLHDLPCFILYLVHIAKESGMQLLGLLQNDGGLVRLSS